MPSASSGFTPWAAALSAVAIAPLAVLPLAAPAAAANFTHIYAFGDSLVDTGNAFAFTGVPPAPYFNGRFSNGPIWTEYLAAGLGIPQTSLGYGGALSNEFGLLLFGGGPVAPVPGLLTQVNAFAAGAAPLDSDALYVLWAGANDYLFAGQTNPAVPVGNYLTAINTLSSAGARNFLLVNLPPLGEVPLLGLQNAPPAVVNGLNTLSAAHNQLLAAAAANLNAAGPLQVSLLDVNSLIQTALAGGFGFGNTTDACTLNPNCVADAALQDTYLFWDEVHPTTAAYRIVADAALAQVSPPAATPEPAISLGLILVGGWGMRQIRRDRPGSGE